MKAITLIDDNPANPSPWASLMEAGVKTIETRTWPVPAKLQPQMPFDLLICASASSRTANKGLAVCVVEVYGCEKLTTAHERGACCDVYEGYGWLTRNLRWMSSKFAVKGKLGVYDVKLPENITIYTPSPEQFYQARIELKNY